MLQILLISVTKQIKFITVSIVNVEQYFELISLTKSKREKERKKDKHESGGVFCLCGLNYHHKPHYEPQCNFMLQSERGLNVFFSLFQRFPSIRLKLMIIRAFGLR